MNCSFTRVPSATTGYFSKIIVDYISGASALRPFYQHPVSPEAAEAAITARKQATTYRALLVRELQQQYRNVQPVDAVVKNIESLSRENVFTICTAHQPAIFTGTLYFVYKILHVIRLAEELNKQLPKHRFVPVFWMGSEDADLDELGKIYLRNEAITWNTSQKGAVGRMSTKGLDKIILRIEGELSVLPFGPQLIALLRSCYVESPDVQTATFKLLHALFAQYGLVVVIPDRAEFKRAMIPVFEDDLFRRIPSRIVEKTVNALDEAYKVQARPRDINLFYLTDDARNRIVEEDGRFRVLDTTIAFTKSELQEELSAHPERFSPNVILRGLFQETILPNIIFVGGGGEMAYWLELKELFEHYHTPYPVLVLRNSFLIVERKWSERIHQLGLTAADIFKPVQQLLTEMVMRNRNGELKLQSELEAAMELYHRLNEKAGNIDATLRQHVEALRAKAIKPLQELEKKMLRAEKKNYEALQRQLQQVKAALFPNDQLQERIENFMPYYATWGEDFFKCLHQYSGTFEQQFGILEEQQRI